MIILKKDEDRRQTKMMIIKMRKIGILAVLTLLTTGSTTTAQIVNECRDAWAYSVDHALCTDYIGAPYWGWTNGRFGSSQCAACNCAECPAPPSTTTEVGETNPPTPAPLPDPVVLPQKCIGHSASFFGDPHIRTFDSLKYDCQGEGEFHILKSLESNFAIQGRFVKFRATERPTVTKSVVFQTGDSDEPLIQVTTPDIPIDGSCMPFVHVNGKITDVLAGGDFLDDNHKVQVALEEKRNKKFQGYIFYYHQSGVQFTVLAKKSSMNGCVLSTKVCMPFDWERSTETFQGLLGGTPDNDPSNDWMDINNQLVDVPTNKEDLRFNVSYDWCVQNWCIQNVEDSMFTYLPEESFDEFKQCDLPADTKTQTCATSPGEELTSVCGTENLACLVDGCTGTVEDAKSLLSTEDEMLEKHCGKEIYFEDFDGDDAKEWGDIQQGKFYYYENRLCSEVQNHNDVYI